MAVPASYLLNRLNRGSSRYNAGDVMLYEHLEDPLLYDGSQIEPAWALSELGIKGSSIITWIGPMDVKNIVDYEDVELEIRSEEVLHFIVEHFDEQPSSLRLAYHRQRILVMLLMEELMRTGVRTRREGDDLYIGSSKLTVSIATASVSSMKIHLGVNIHERGTPEDVDTIGLLDEKPELSADDIKVIAENVAMAYIHEIDSIEEDIAKTRIF
ncbi:conserved protein [Methanothermobacter thermautotrophicus str. Delta H]|uniref:Conserved protein n=2 Tax=Methanobacteriaceae TaxID=2159 RepID=O27297_METTH|nr:conserved protein [Methanothermobacter thermautotrophicus str. Delta H]BAZ99245.1 hypothetical protein tca_01186 [Methanothermobacter sp. EMTCatA1]